MPLRWEPTQYRKSPHDEVADTGRDLEEWRGRFRVRPTLGGFALEFNGRVLPGSPFETPELAKLNAQARVDQEIMDSAAS